LNSADSSSLLEYLAWLTPSWCMELEKPTSATLIAPVVTITPVPLLYHVRTFYILCYNFPTTHPTQFTYTRNELQKKEKKKNQRRERKKRKGEKSRTHSQNKTMHNIHMKRIIQIITKPTSTTNSRIHPFKTTFHILNGLPTYEYITSKQHSCVQGPRAIVGVMFDSVGSPWTTLLLRTTCMCSCCNWSASCLVVQIKI